MNTRLTHTLRCASAILAAAATYTSRLAAQETIPHDTARSAPTFQRDTLVRTLYVERQGIAIHSEVDSAGRPTGHYAVFSVWPRAARFVTAYMDWAYDQPSVAFVANGRPAVVLLASYTGGLGRQGIPNCALKLLVLHDGDSASAFTITPADAGSFPTAGVAAFTRTGARSFRLRITGGPTILYVRGRVTVK